MSSAPRRFAEETEVPVERSRAELEQLLGRHGATQRMTAVDDETGQAVLTFRLSGRIVRLRMTVVPKDLPDPTKSATLHTPNGWNTWTVPRRQAWLELQRAQAARSAWRRLLLVVKAKLELVRDGASTFEREFLADILLPDGQTVHEALEPQLVASYASGSMPPLLPPAPEPKGKR